jgi:acetyl-CoA synthetase
MPSIIAKHSDPRQRAANLLDYPAACRSFTWRAARAELSGLPGDKGLNIAHEAVDRFAHGPHAGAVALRWLGKDAQRRDFSYAELAELSSRFANLLEGLGVEPGELVCTLLGRIPALYVAALGTLKRRAVFSPLFSAFGPEPIKTRLQLGRAKVLITTAALYERKVQSIRAALPTLEHVLIVGDAEHTSLPQGTLDYATSMRAASPAYTIAKTAPSDPALLHFTSGTTGAPKAAVHVHEAVVMHHITGRYALDLHPGDVFWCTADPGWVTGTSYGIIAPLTNRATLVVDEAEFDVERWYEILERERVEVFYTAPTAIRRLMRAGVDLAHKRNLSGLRFLASVGEPLNPEAVIWSQEAFGKPFHDNWWQTETGGIVIANFASLDVKPGSMGVPLPGIEAKVVVRGQGGVLETVPEDQIGELALRTGWPSMFRAYLHAPERYAKCFAEGYYLTGDLVRRDRDGYYWFVGRNDDVIKTAGHLVGPFEVESALMEHPAVVEAAMIGKPDPVAGNLLKAFVVLRAGHAPSDALRSELLGFARKRLGAAIAPRELEITTTLPRTRSGKILRRLLRARELGLPEGDLSTLEEDKP